MLGGNVVINTAVHEYPYHRLCWWKWTHDSRISVIPP